MIEETPIHGEALLTRKSLPCVCALSSLLLQAYSSLACCGTGSYTLSIEPSCSTESLKYGIKILFLEKVPNFPTQILIEDHLNYSMHKDGERIYSILTSSNQQNKESNLNSLT